MPSNLRDLCAQRAHLRRARIVRPCSSQVPAEQWAQLFRRRRFTCTRARGAEIGLAMETLKEGVDVGRLWQVTTK